MTILREAAKLEKENFVKKEKKLATSLEKQIVNHKKIKLDKEIG